jgi:FlaA1/EpsC-like NDP-sugar epimerase
MPYRTLKIIDLATPSPRKYAVVNLKIEQFPRFLQPLLRYFHVDFTPQGQPSGAAVLFATVVSIIGSLVVDALLVVIGTKIFPSTKGYGHFQFSDYSKLTIIGVIIACGAWPIVTRMSSMPRWLFVRMAIVVTLVLLIPDLLIWVQGSPGKAVFVLVWMHVAIGVVTYNVLVRLAPPRRSSRVSHARHARK